MKYRQSLRWLWSRRWLRFIVVGIWNTLFGISISFILYYYLHEVLQYMLIALLGNVIAVTMAFLAQRRLVFRSKNPILKEYFRFYSVYSLSIIFGLSALPILVGLMGMSFYVAQAIILLITVICSFLGHQRFTFNRSID